MTVLSVQRLVLSIPYISDCGPTGLMITLIIPLHFPVKQRLILSQPQVQSVHWLTEELFQDVPPDLEVQRMLFHPKDLGSVSVS